VQTMIWFLAYLLLIVALATWRSHHDAAVRSRKHGAVDRALDGRWGARGRRRPPRLRT
jgi:hypothetical protein